MTAPQAALRSASQPARPRVGRSARSRANGSLWQELIGEVDWSVGYVAFLYYVFVVITYWLPFADVAIVIALVALLLKPQDWRMSPFLWTFAAFAVWCLLSYLASPYRSSSWLQTNAVLKLWLICFTAYSVIRTRANLRFFLAFAIGAFVLFPARGAFINYFGGYNVFGRALWNFAYANPNDLAAFALIFTSMSIALFFASRHKLIRLGALGTSGLLLLLILFTQSRGAMIATAVVGVLFLIVNRHNGRILLGAVALSVVAAYFAPRSVWDRLAGLANASVASGFRGVDQERSAEQRFQLLTIGSRIARDNMVFGVGPGVYPIVHGEYARTAKGEMPLAAGNRDPHNTIVRTAAETGVIGLLLFSSMIGQALIRARRRLKGMGKNADPVIRFLSFGVIAFMVAGLFGSFTYLNVLYLQLSLLELAMLLTVNRRSPQPVASVSPLRRRRALAPQSAILQGT